jgi:UDP-N-acetylglucosamine 1-carboxyvinyltransferase
LRKAIVGDIIQIMQQESFVIRGGNRLNGHVYIQGSKNAAPKLIAAALLTTKPCKLLNVPHVKDVDVMLDILKAMGAKVEFKKNVATITCANIDPQKIPNDLAKRLRSSVVLIGPLLARFGKITLPYPGGDRIGLRSLSTHFNAFRDLGYEVAEDRNYYQIKKGAKFSRRAKISLDEFSVTATENVLMWSAIQPGKLEISMVAEEPHVQNLVEMLQKMGASINVFPRHRIVIKGKKSLEGASQKVFYDYIEAGTWLIAGTLLAENLHIHNFPVQDLELLMHRLKRIGADFQLLSKNTLFVKKAPKLTASKWDVRLHPGVASDLQSPLGVLATQCSGVSEIFDTMYEGRLSYLKELQKMGANVKILDVRRAEVTGPTKLKGIKFLKKEDIRGGMSLIIAGLIASGETFIKDAYQVDRGYERIDERLQELGANIKRVTSNTQQATKAC